MQIHFLAFVYVDICQVQNLHAVLVSWSTQATRWFREESSPIVEFSAEMIIEIKIFLILPIGVKIRHKIYITQNDIQGVPKTLGHGIYGFKTHFKTNKT